MLAQVYWGADRHDVALSLYGLAESKAMRVGARSLVSVARAARAACLHLLGAPNAGPALAAVSQPGARGNSLLLRLWAAGYRGLALKLAGDPHALATLSQAAELAREREDHYRLIGALVHLADLALQDTDQPTARSQVASALGLAAASGIWHFDLWDPATARRVLEFAIAQRIQPAYARAFLDRRQLRDGAAASRHARADGVPDWASAAARQAGLTPREWEVMALLIEPVRDRGIAVRLSISWYTARTHIKTILDKLGVRSRAEAVAVVLGHTVPGTPKAKD
ncbi:MAG: helix-turn-helix transcriptional regulator [Chloroflexi bacterium]|nr:helix-turn-helix transcriptional regulator [Chloroflexota bacterium]